MKYLCLIYDDESQFETFSKPDMDKMMSEYRVFGESIRKSGHHVASYQLQPTDAATTVRSRNGKVSTTDGPFAETKEQLGGFFLIEAKDLNEAVQIASRVPSVRTGSIEVRPVVERNQTTQSTEALASSGAA